MKITNNTDTELVVTKRSTTTSMKIFAGTSAHVDLEVDDIVIRCCYGRVYIVKTPEIYEGFRMYPHEDLGSMCEFDYKSMDFVVTVYRVTAANKRSNSWFEQQDETLYKYKKSIRDDSIHMNSTHITAFKRIDELTDAIKKSIQICVPNETTSDVKLIRNWAKEIMLQCNIIDSIDED